MRKITFEVEIADGFVFLEDDGITNIHMWPVAVGNVEHINIDIKFEPAGGDVMKEAEQALDKHIKEKYPNKDYRIYYWWWTN